MAIKFKDFLIAYMGENKDVDDLDVYVYNTDEDESYRLKCSIRNYLLFGNYYVEGFSVDWYPSLEGHRKPFLSVTIVKKKLDSFENYSFTYK